MTRISLGDEKEVATLQEKPLKVDVIECSGYFFGYYSDFLHFLGKMEIAELILKITPGFSSNLFYTKQKASSKIPIFKFLASMKKNERQVTYFRYRWRLRNKKEFQEIEKSKVPHWNNYTQYGGYGIYLYFMPSPLSIFFNNTNLFTDLTALVDVGERSSISKSFKGKEIFSQKPKKLWDFTGIVILLGSFMALYYGYEAFRDREYLKFLTIL